MCINVTDWYSGHCVYPSAPNHESGELRLTKHLSRSRGRGNTTHSGHVILAITPVTRAGHNSSITPCLLQRATQNWLYLARLLAQE